MRENLTASEETAVRKTTPIPIEQRCLYEAFFLDRIFEACAELRMRDNLL